MVQITYRSAAMGEQTLDIDADSSLMEGGLFGGVPGIQGLCGGSVACGTCHIHIAEPWFSRLGKAGDSETELLEDLAGYTPASRLACQIRVTPEMDGLVVDVVAN